MVPSDGRMKISFLHRKVTRPLLELLRQGVTPEKLALSVALGVVFGLIPAIGWNTVLCAIAAVLWKLNLPAIQLVNYTLYPAQIALILPFFRLGEKVFGAPHLPIRVPQIYAMIHADWWGAIRLLWTTTWHAVTVWAVIAPFVCAGVYFALLPAFHRVVRRQRSAVSTERLRVTG
jgi:uncharacterized protein (DUF2062 family)